MIEYQRTDEPIIARAFSFGPWQTVTLGSWFADFAPDMQVAILTHEEGHCELRHTEQRILCLLFMPFLFWWLCRRQEFAADLHAVRAGHAPQLLKLLAHDYDGGWYQPSHAARRAAITKFFAQLRSVPVTDISPDAA